MPFRTSRGIPDSRTTQTFDSVRLCLEPTLYAKHFQFRVDPESWLNPSTFETEWGYYPVPFYFDPESGEIKRAWIKGSLDIRYIVTYTNKAVTMRFNVGNYGDDPQEITSTVIPKADASELRLYTAYLKEVDLSLQDVIGFSADIQEEVEYAFYVSVSLLWRPFQL